MGDATELLAEVRTLAAQLAEDAAVLRLEKEGRVRLAADVMAATAIRVRDGLTELAAMWAPLAAAATGAEVVLSRLDTTRHLDPEFPALDGLRAAIGRTT